MKASPLKEPPIPIPACAAIPRDLDDVEAEDSCAAVVKVVNADIFGGTFVGDEEVDDENPLATLIEKAPTVGDDTVAVGKTLHQAE